jgi:hypothetical protein
VSGDATGALVGGRAGTFVGGHTGAVAGGFVGTRAGARDRHLGHDEALSVRELVWHWLASWPQKCWK